MSAIEEATSRNRGIPCKVFKSLIKLYLSCFIFYDFPIYIKNYIKGKTFVYVRRNVCQPLRHLRTETGESLAKTPNH